MEFAIVLALVLCPMFCGIYDCAKFLNAGNVLSRAVREGAVQASRGQDPVSVVKAYVASAGFDAAQVSVAVDPGEGAPGTEMRVAAHYNMSDFSLVPWEVIHPRGINVAATVRRE